MTHFANPNSASSLLHGCQLAAILGAFASVLLAQADAAPPEDRQHWSFRPLARPAIDEQLHSRARTPVDAFLLRRLQSKGLSFSPDADISTLVRRTHLDLLGIPPAPEVL